MASNSPRAGQLQAVPCCASNAAFKPASCSEKMDALGINPIPKVHARSSIVKKSKPSAIDKQYRHVALLQWKNRQAAAEAQQQEEQEQHQREQLAEFTAMLRTAVLNGDREVLTQRWEPAAAAARLREQQQQSAAETQQVLARFQDSNSSRASIPSKQVTTKQAKSAASPARRVTDNSDSGSSSNGTGQHAHQESAADGEDDVDAFLDGLLQKATEAQTASSTSSGNKVNSKSGHVEPATTTASSTAGSAPISTSRPGTASPIKQQQQQQQQQRKSKPAWALTEQQQADVAAAAEAEAVAAEAAEEEELLDFAQQLEWEVLVGQLDDEQLAAAFKELDLAEQQQAAAVPGADSQWRKCFVTALNHTALSTVVASNAAAAAGSEAGDDARSEGALSTASQVARRAERTATSRQKLLARLARMSGGSVAGHGCVGSEIGSIDGGQDSGQNAANGPTGRSEWDASTCAGDDVGRLQAALGALQAGDVLAENPEMKGVYSVASMRSMLAKRESAAGQSAQ